VKTTSNTVPSARRVPPFQFAMVLVALLLSVFLIYQGLAEYFSGGDPNTVSLYLMMGTGLLAVSSYVVLQTRRRMLKLMSMEMQPLSTTLICQKCGFRNLRDFQRGDFVFKKTDEGCPKDNEKMVISAIYREVKDKEKEKAKE